MDGKLKVTNQNKLWYFFISIDLPWQHTFILRAIPCGYIFEWFSWETFNPQKSACHEKSLMKHLVFAVYKFLCFSSVFCKTIIITRSFPPANKKGWAAYPLRKSFVTHILSEKEQEALLSSTTLHSNPFITDLCRSLEGRWAPPPHHISQT